MNVTARCRTKNPSSMDYRALAQVRRWGKFFFWVLTSRQPRLVTSHDPVPGTVTLLDGQTRFVCYICDPANYSKHYARKGDLVRYINKDHNPPRYHCHVDRCPRSILGNGFGRKDKLVDHLKSKKTPHHGLSHEDAVFQAALHNTSNKQDASQAVVHSTSNQDSLNYADLYGTSNGHAM
jgi:hypothetical protein